MNQNRDPRMAKRPINVGGKKKSPVLKKNKRRDSSRPQVKQRSLFSKILSGLAMTVLTVMLIGLITGSIVVGAFAIYIIPNGKEMVALLPDVRDQSFYSLLGCHYASAALLTPIQTTF